MGKVILIASGKGGTGKTMFAVNFAATLANCGKRTVVLDMDLGLRNLDLYLGLENNVVYDVYDVMTGLCKIKQALIPDKRFENLYFMAASPNREEGMLTPLHMKVLCRRLAEKFDYVLIDSPSGIDDNLVLASAGADEAIIITNPEYAALRDADALDREFLKLGINKRWAVLNKVIADMINRGFAPSLQEVSSLIRAPLAGVIQFDENIHISTCLGIPIVLKDDTYIRENFINIANRIIEEKEEEVGLK
ncbi:septum site-determining protein MinD [Peptostreptococcaceae bacterium pGA-8]|nr:septum site-determining protein MinD [Peptostreptococcaceae bacterium pGA-8]